MRSDWRETSLAAVGVGQLGQRGIGGVAQLGRIAAQLLENREHDPLGLREQGSEDVIGGDLGVIGGLGRVK